VTDDKTTPLEDLLLDTIAYGIAYGVGYGQHQGAFARSGYRSGNETTLKFAREKAERITDMFASTTTDRSARPLFSLRMAIRNALADVAESPLGRFMPLIADELPEKASPEALHLRETLRTDPYMQQVGNTLAKRFFLSMIDQGWEFTRVEQPEAEIPPEQKAWFENTGEETPEPDNPAPLTPYYDAWRRAREGGVGPVVVVGTARGMNPSYDAYRRTAFPSPPFGLVDPNFTLTTLPRHSYAGEGETEDGSGYEPCRVEGCGLSPRHVTHEPEAGWPPQDSGA
jgi:hypothetical protein